MSNDTAGETHRQLDALWSDGEVPKLPIEGKRYIIVSDLHLGNGSKADNFIRNQGVFRAAASYYLDRDYALILAGDTEELWQFDLSEVRRRYDESLYGLLRRFGPGRLIRIFGNHDCEWGPMPDPASGQSPRGGCAEAVKLLDASGVARVLITHGHQGSLDSDKWSWFSRFFVHLYRFVEPLTHFLSDDPAATMSDISKTYERLMYAWARKNRVLLICGHSHRAVAASLSCRERLEKQKRELENKLPGADAGGSADIVASISALERELAQEKKRRRNFVPVEAAGPPVPCYWNAGCCCYSNGLTGIEIAEGRIGLVRWRQGDPRNPEPLGGGPMLVSECFANGPS